MSEIGKASRKKAFTKTKAIVHHQDDGEGNWLVSYADMMTLLFGFFVMISAFSTPNAGKFEKMKKETAQAMGAKYTNPYTEMNSSVKTFLKDFNLEENEVSLEETLNGVTITSKGTLFFDSGSAELKPKALELVNQLANILLAKAKGFRIVVEGHTDDSPYLGKSFASNWELSSSRAGTVVRLLESKGFAHTDLMPIGMADTQPIVPNRSATGEAIPENQAENRRIVIRIEKQLPQRTSR